MPSTALRLLALPALLAALGPTAMAQESSPYYLGGNAGLTHVSNLFRVAGTPNSDRVTTLGVLAGLDRRLGRQRLMLDGSLQTNRYAENGYLDNTSSTLKGSLDWQTVGDLSGLLSASRNRALAEYNIGSGVAPIFKRNVQSLDEYQALTRLGLASRYSLEAGVSHRRQAFTAEEYDRFAYNQTTGSLGAYLKPGGNLKVGVAGRYTKGKFPRFPVSPIQKQAADYRRHDLDLTASWRTGGASQLDARLSRSQTRNTIAGINSFRGTTGQLAWNWQPTSKTGLRVQAGRDTGSEALAGGVDGARLYSNYSATFSYAPTGKLTLQATRAHTRSHLANPLSPIDFFDTTDTTSLAARWAFSRSMSLSCQLARSSRDSSQPLYVYTANSYGCNGQALLF